MKAAVFGFTGLLGRAVVDELIGHGHDVVRMGRGIDACSADLVFDCSGRSSTISFDGDGFSEAWSASTSLLIENMGRVSGFKRYVFASSSRVYSVRDGTSVATGEHRTPTDLLHELLSSKKDRYALSKLTCETLLLHELGDSGISVRFCGLYGDGMKKGVFYDVANQVELRCSPDSEFHLLNSTEAARMMVCAASKDAPCVNATAANFTTPSRIADELNVPLVWGGGVEWYFANHVVDRIKLGILGENP